MKGVIFNVLEDLVISKCGVPAWNEVLSENPEATGIYTASESYPDEELFGLVGSVAQKLEMSVADVVQTFGTYLFHQLAERYPMFVEQPENLREFLLSIESVIHIEVRKLYDSPNLPSFTYDESSQDQLVMHYQSPRKLCILAEGLVRGAAEYYKTPITIDHPVCMHQGADHCDLVIRFGNV